LDDILYHPHLDVAQIANFVSGDLGWELTHIKPQSVLHANVSFTFSARPLIEKVLHCSLVGGSFLKQRYALLSNSSRIVSNLAGDFDPSCAKQINVVFSSTEMPDFLPINMHFAENFENIQS
jgi:hypothetical protein